MFRRSFAVVVVVGVLGFSIPAQAWADEINIEYYRGFRTLVAGEHLPAYWESVKDRHKMRGKVSDYLTRDQIESIIVLELNIAVAHDPRSPTLEDEVLSLMTEGSEFQAGPLPDSVAKNPRRELAAVFRTKSGDYGLITRFREVAILELAGRIGVVPVNVDDK